MGRLHRVPSLTVPDPAITDGVVSLRAWVPDDVDWITQACQDPEIPRWTPAPRPYTETHARAFVAAAADALASGEAAHLAVIGARTSERLGSIGLVTISWNLRAADVGYWTDVSARGCGFAGRALSLMVRWALEDLGLARLELRAHRENLASQAVARRAGFIPEATPVLARPECDTRDMVLFARRRQD